MPSELSVIQLIDTLDAGGAERVAVNLANALARRGYQSYLCATRRGGPLEKEIDPGVRFILLGRKNRWDVGAVLRLRQLIRRERIQIIHAHSSSLFIGSLASLLTGSRLVWHDHYGPGSTYSRPAWLYRMTSRRVDRVFTVTRTLADWATRVLGISAAQVQYLPNFVIGRKTPQTTCDLPGTAGHRIVCVANIRPVKDQIVLLQAMQILQQRQPEAHLLLVGAASDSAYYAAAEAERQSLHLEDRVTFLGKRDDVAQILAGSDIAVLASRFEGFPLAVLEYGRANLPVVATNVGECAEILDHGSAGILVEPGSSQALAAALNGLLCDPHKRSFLGERLAQRVETIYSEAAIMTTILHEYRIIQEGSANK